MEKYKGGGGGGYEKHNSTCDQKNDVCPDQNKVSRFKTNPYSNLLITYLNEKEGTLFTNWIFAFTLHWALVFTMALSPKKKTS